jgi:hypothetical protein
MNPRVAILLSLAFHASLLVGARIEALRAQRIADALPLKVAIQMPLEHENTSGNHDEPRNETSQPASLPPSVKRSAPIEPVEAIRHAARAEEGSTPKSVTDKKPASMPAPPPPSAEEWQLASTYKLKNSKRYRNSWGQQVRSMMGTAVEGPDQGMVRFRIEIAPDGKIANIKELWSTSEGASKLAWEAIRALPQLPPTPTGEALIFERTISFLPYETGWPPSYTLDCLPDPPAFKNPFVWDGTSSQPVAQARTKNDLPASDAIASTDCITDSTADTIEEEETAMKRQMEIWRWGR